MQWELKRLSRRDVDYELALGVLLVPLCAAAGALVALLPARLTPICAVHATSGIPCPTCGTLRCIRLALAGRPGAAFVTQPFMATLMAVALAYSLYSWIIVLGRLPRIRIRCASRGFGWWIATAVLAALVLNWAYLIIAGR
jgi:hypothetical protein